MAKSKSAQWNTIHIFGYGETQIIGNGTNKKVPTSLLTFVQAVIDNVYAQKPTDNDSSVEYHAINIFNNMFCDYQPKTGEGFRTQFENLDATHIEALAGEIVAYEPPVTE